MIPVERPAIPSRFRPTSEIPYTGEGQESGGFTSEVLPSFIYFARFMEDVEAAQYSIIYQAMHPKIAHATQLLYHGLTRQARKGKSVVSLSDYYSFLEGQYDSMGRKMDEQTIDLTKEMIDGVADAGGQVIYTNKPNPIVKRLPKIGSLIGRNHTKLGLIDGLCGQPGIAYYGGVNPYEGIGGWNAVDFMVRTDHPQLVQAIANQILRVNENSPSRDYAKPCGEDYWLMVDAGKVGSSVIYDETVKLARDPSQGIRYVSQVMPTGKLLDAMIEQAKNGALVEILLSYEEDGFYTSPPFKQYYQLRFVKRVENVPNLTYHHAPDRTKVHAKLFQTTLADGTMVSVVGSHNLSPIGGWAATQEVSVMTKDPVLNAQLSELYVDTRETVYAGEKTCGK